MSYSDYRDPEARRKYQAEYRASHRERKAQLNAAWKAKNREAWERYQAEYRSKNRAKRRAAGRLWRQNSKALQRAYYEKHREKILANSRVNYAKNRARRLRQSREYYRRNPQVSIKGYIKRKFRIEVTIENEHAIEQFIKLIRGSKRVACQYCGRMVSGRKAHIDHVVPLSRGGPHAVENLCASCPSCNLSKGAKLLSEWKRPGQRLLPL